MSGPFTITTATSSVRLDSERRGEMTFTVFNASGLPIRGRARLVPQESTAEAWLSVDEETEEDFDVAGTTSYTVRVAVPADAPAGRYSFRLDMVGVENPDELYSQGPTGVFQVPKPVSVSPFPWWIPVVAGGVVLLVGGVLLAFLLWPRTTEVPELEGEAIAGATAILAQAGLEVGEVDGESGSSIPRAYVVRSVPPAGEGVRRGTPVDLFVSTGPQAVEVPNFAGQGIDEALAALEAAGLALGATRYELPEPAPGEAVIRSDPAAGEEIRPGEPVTLFVSTGPGVVVPDVTDESIEQAEELLEAAGLTLGTVEYAPVESGAVDQVLRSDPTAGQSVPPGWAVDLQVAAAVDLVLEDVSLSDDHRVVLTVSNPDGLVIAPRFEYSLVFFVGVLELGTGRVQISGELPTPNSGSQALVTDHVISPSIEVSVCIDPRGYIIEYDESNNEWQGEL